MTITDVPWLELSLLSCLAGVAAMLLSRAPMAWAVASSGLALAFSVAEFLCHYAGVARPGMRWVPWLEVDGLSAPLLPMVGLLHLLAALTTPKAKADRVAFAVLLLSLATQLAAFGCKAPWPLIALLAAGTLPPWADLVSRGKPSRLFASHMLLFVLLLAGGRACVESGYAGLGAGMLIGAVLVRCGMAPVHSWVPALFADARFGTALAFALPLAGAYAAVRLVLPLQDVPEWVMRGMGSLALLTAVCAAGLAVVQREARRFFACLFLGHAALVLVGLELRTEIGLTGSLTLWFASTLSLGGLGLVLRAVEARFGRLSLEGYLGLHSQTPTLAGCFLLMGLASVGFPGTIGFICGELLVEGAVTHHPLVGLAVILAGTLNGVAIMRAYFLLFTGAKHVSGVPLGITLRERLAVVVLSLLILLGGLWPQPGVKSRHDAAMQVLGGRGATPAAPHEE